MSKAEELAAKAAALKAKRERGHVPDVDESAAGPESTSSRRSASAPPRERDMPASQSSVRVKPVRATVDIPPGRFAQLKAWQGETAVQLGRSRVTNQDVFGAMLSRLLTDETFARKIRDDLRKDTQ